MRRRAATLSMRPMYMESSGPHTMETRFVRWLGKTLRVWRAQAQAKATMPRVFQELGLQWQVERQGLP